MNKWEYLSIRFDYKGRGITQEFNLFDMDGQRLTGWTSEGGNTAKTLPQFLALVGEEGWELASHVVNQDMQANSVTWHYMHFKRLLSATQNDG